MRRTVLVVLVAAVLGACATGAPSTDTPRAVSAPDYLEEALALLDDGLHAGTDAWAAAREDAVEQVTAATSIADVHAVVDRLATIAGGPHSTFRTPEEVRAWEAESADTPDLPSVEVDVDVGVLTLPPFPVDEPELVQQYVDAGLAGIAEHTDADLCGWVIDVQFNTGGNAHPMIAAASPLLTDGPVLGLREQDGTVTELVVDGNSVLVDDQVLAVGSGDPFKVSTPSVAVRQGRMTASAGEAVVVAFSGEATARTFGAPTRGFTSGNRYLELSDGAGLTVTTGLFQDRRGTAYDGRLAPGIEGADAVTAADGLTEEEWIRERCSRR
ncbi:S41 family peptidase [Sanguibacter suaedae]|uniref:Tail specific protease domain-containing protein n=1 Tax=Sanguibacter suaedae TaxID=2795737 RepID=A0A934IC09_9MICO|nr:S41 family peptidase [Sanguibacter suaedae]MBI9115612.1 hypothetical protein [Sanguibacter suaedae]